MEILGVIIAIILLFLGSLVGWHPETKAGAAEAVVRGGTISNATAGDLPYIHRYLTTASLTNSIIRIWRNSADYPTGFILADQLPDHLVIRTIQPADDVNISAQLLDYLLHEHHKTRVDAILDKTSSLISFYEKRRFYRYYEDDKVIKLSNKPPHMFIRISGDSTTKSAIVLISGLGNDHRWWNWQDQDEDIRNDPQFRDAKGKVALQPLVSKFTKVMSFDYPGMGYSKYLAVPKDVKDLCQQIEKIRAQYLTPQIVLVGHSIGSVVARIYYGLYSKQVQGMMLLDPTMDFTLAEMRKRNYYTKHLQSDLVDTQKTKYQTTYNYIQMFNRSQRMLPKLLQLAKLENLQVHYNWQYDDPTHEKYEDTIKKHFPMAVKHIEKTHWFHVLEPESLTITLERFASNET